MDDVHFSMCTSPYAVMPGGHTGAALQWSFAVGGVHNQSVVLKVFSNGSVMDDFFIHSL